MRDFRSDNLINSIERENSSLFRSFLIKVTSFILIIFMIFGIFPCNPFMHIDAPIAPLAVKSDAQSVITDGSKKTIVLNNETVGPIIVEPGISKLVINVTGDCKVQAHELHAISCGMRKNGKSYDWWDCQLEIIGKGSLIVDNGGGTGLYVRGNFTIDGEVDVICDASPSYNSALILGGLYVKQGSYHGYSQPGRSTPPISFGGPNIGIKEGKKEIDKLGEIKIVGKPKLAEIVGKASYYTVDEAIDAANNGDTIKILADTDFSRAITKNITLDLNGKKLSGKGKITAQSENTIITLKDSSNGSGKYSAGDITAISGRVVIKSGTYTSAIYQSSNGIIEINGGTFDTLVITRVNGKLVATGGKFKKYPSGYGTDGSLLKGMLGDDTTIGYKAKHYEVYEIDRNYWGIRERPTIATIGSDNYKDIEDALRDFGKSENSGKTLTLLANVTCKEQISISVSGNSKINLNGYSLDASNEIEITVPNNGSLIVSGKDSNIKANIIQNGDVTINGARINGTYTQNSGTLILESNAIVNSDLTVGDGTTNTNFVLVEDSYIKNVIMTNNSNVVIGGGTVDGLLTFVPGSVLTITDGVFENTITVTDINLLTSSDTKINYSVTGGKYKFKPDTKFITNHYFFKYEDGYFSLAERQECAYVLREENTKYDDLSIAFQHATKEGDTVVVYADCILESTQYISTTNLKLDIRNGSSIYSEVTLFEISNGKNFEITNSENESGSIYMNVLDGPSEHAIDIDSDSTLKISGPVDIGSNRTTIKNYNVSEGKGIYIDVDDSLPAASVYTTSAQHCAIENYGSIYSNNAKIENNAIDFNDNVKAKSLYCDENGNDKVAIKLYNTGILGEYSYFSNTDLLIDNGAFDYKDSNDKTQLAQIELFNSYLEINDCEADKTKIITSGSNVTINDGRIREYHQKSGTTVVNGGCFDDITTEKLTDTSITLNGGLFKQNQFKLNPVNENIKFNKDKNQSILITNPSDLSERYKTYVGYYLIRPRPEMVINERTNNKYTSIKLAFDDAYDGDILRLIITSDLPESITKTNLNVTLDFDGYDIQDESTTIILEKSNVVFKNGKGTGGIFSPSVIANDGIISTDNVTFVNDIKLQNLKLQSNNSIFNGVFASNTNLTITGGSATDIVVDERSTLNFAEASANTINAKGRSKVNLKSATTTESITANDHTIVSVVDGLYKNLSLDSSILDFTSGRLESDTNLSNDTEAYINGGEINSLIINNASKINISDVSIDKDITVNGNNQSVKILGGTFEGNINYNTSRPTDTEITGGIFNISPNKEIINSNYTAKEENDGYYHIIAKPEVVSIKNKKTYKDPEQAFIDAVDGDTIILLEDIELSKKVAFTGKNITLEMAGKSIKTSVDELFTLYNSSLEIINNGAKRSNITNETSIGNNYLFNVSSTSSLLISEGVIVNAKESIINTDGLTVLEKAEVYSSKEVIKNNGLLDINNSIISSTDIILTNTDGNINRVTFTNSTIGSGEINLGYSSNVVINDGEFHNTVFNVKERQEVSPTDSDTDISIDTNVVINSGMFRFDPTSYTDLDVNTVIIPKVGWYKIILKGSDEDLPEIPQDTKFDIWVKGQQITGENYNKWDENSWGYNSDTNTLILKNFEVNYPDTNALSKTDDSVIFVSVSNLNIKLVGENFVSAIGGKFISAKGTNTDISIIGNGKLDTNAPIEDIGNLSISGLNIELDSFIDVSNKLSVLNSSNIEIFNLLEKSFAISATDLAVDIDSRITYTVNSSDTNYGIVVSNTNFADGLDVIAGPSQDNARVVKKTNYVSELKNSKYGRIGTTDDYGISVDGINLNSFVTKGTGWYYDAKENILTLDNINLTNLGIISNKSIIIALKGTNKFDMVGPAITVNGELTFADYGYLFASTTDIAIKANKIDISSGHIELSSTNKAINGNINSHDAIINISSDGEEIVENYNNEKYVEFYFEKEFYGIYVDGTEIYAGNKDDVFGDGTVSYDNDLKELKLSNFNGEKIEVRRNIPKFYINLDGQNILKSSETNVIDALNVDLIIFDSSNNSGTLSVESVNGTDNIFPIVAKDLMIYKGYYEFKDQQNVYSLTNITIPYDSIVSKNMEKIDASEVTKDLSDAQILEIGANLSHKHLFSGRIEYVWERTTTATDYTYNDYVCHAISHCADVNCDCYDCADAEIFVSDESRRIYVAKFENSAKFPDNYRVIVNDAAYLVSDGETLTAKLMNTKFTSETSISKINVNNKDINGATYELPTGNDASKFFTVVVTANDNKKYTLVLNNTFKVVTSFACDVTELEKAITEGKELLENVEKKSVAVRVTYEGLEPDKFYVDPISYEIFENELNNATNILNSSNRLSGKDVTQEEVDNAVTKLHSAKKDFINYSGISNILVENFTVSVVSNNENINVTKAEYIDDAFITTDRYFDTDKVESHKLLSILEPQSFITKGSGVWTFKVTEELFGLSKSYMEYVILSDSTDEELNTPEKVAKKALDDLLKDYEEGGQFYSTVGQKIPVSVFAKARIAYNKDSSAADYIAAAAEFYNNVKVNEFAVTEEAKAPEEKKENSITVKADKDVVTISGNNASYVLVAFGEFYSVDAMEQAGYTMVDINKAKDNSFNGVYIAPFKGTYTLFVEYLDGSTAMKEFRVKDDVLPLVFMVNNSDEDIIFKKVGGFDIESIYYTYGTPTDAIATIDYSKMVKIDDDRISAEPFGTGTHTFVVKAKFNGVTSTYIMSVEAAKCNHPHVIFEKGTVIASTHGFENDIETIAYAKGKFTTWTDMADSATYISTNNLMLDSNEFTDGEYTFMYMKKDGTVPQEYIVYKTINNSEVNK